MKTHAAKLEIVETPSERVDRVWTQFYGPEAKKPAQRPKTKEENQRLTPATPPD